jgi:hypothetical protein
MSYDVHVIIESHLLTILSLALPGQLDHHGGQLVGKCESLETIL